jgi:hypothetical protein
MQSTAAQKNEPPISEKWVVGAETWVASTMLVERMV